MGRVAAEITVRWGAHVLHHGLLQRGGFSLASDGSGDVTVPETVLASRRVELCRVAPDAVMVAMPPGFEERGRRGDAPPGDPYRSLLRPRQRAVEPGHRVVLGRDEFQLEVECSRAVPRLPRLGRVDRSVVASTASFALLAVLVLLVACYSVPAQPADENEPPLAVLKPVTMTLPRERPAGEEQADGVSPRWGGWFLSSETPGVWSPDRRFLVDPLPSCPRGIRGPLVSRGGYEWAEAPTAMEGYLVIAEGGWKLANDPSFDPGTATTSRNDGPLLDSAGHLAIPLGLPLPAHCHADSFSCRSVSIGVRVLVLSAWTRGRFPESLCAIPEDASLT